LSNNKFDKVFGTTPTIDIKDIDVDSDDDDDTENESDKKLQQTTDNDICNDGKIETTTTKENRARKLIGAPPLEEPPNEDTETSITTKATSQQNEITPTATPPKASSPEPTKKRKYYMYRKIKIEYIIYNLHHLFFMKKKRNEQSMSQEIATVSDSPRKIVDEQIKIKNKTINKLNKKATSNTITIILPDTHVECTEDHSQPKNYNPNSEKAYFTDSYYNNRPDCTNKCKDCGGIFGKQIKIATKTPAMCCNKQFDKTNPCSHAYCMPCFLKWQGYNKKEILNNEQNDENKIN
jgi:hypothetical protein